LGEGFIRISLSTPDARLEEAMARIVKVKDQLAPAATAH
jgi:aspartate/methionine/tyrosine aminotransferase